MSRYSKYALYQDRFRRRSACRPDTNPHSECVHDHSVNALICDRFGRRFKARYLSQRQACCRPVTTPSMLHRQAGRQCPCKPLLIQRPRTRRGPELRTLVTTPFAGAMPGNSRDRSCLRASLTTRESLHRISVFYDRRRRVLFVDRSIIVACDYGVNPTDHGWKRATTNTGLLRSRPDRSCVPRTAPPSNRSSVEQNRTVGQSRITMRPTQRDGLVTQKRTG
jgi:hypothetical protein